MRGNYTGWRENQDQNRGVDARHTIEDFLPQNSNSFEGTPIGYADKAYTDVAKAAKRYGLENHTIVRGCLNFIKHFPSDTEEIDDYYQDTMSWIFREGKEIEEARNYAASAYDEIWKTAERLGVRDDPIICTSLDIIYDDPFDTRAVETAYDLAMNVLKDKGRNTRNSSGLSSKELERMLRDEYFRAKAKR